MSHSVLPSFSSIYRNIGSNIDLVFS